MSKFIEEQEIPKHKKKSKNKGRSRSKHKHNYKPCLCHFIWKMPSIKTATGYEEHDEYFYSEYCTECGRLTNQKAFESEPWEGHPGMYRMLTKKEILNKYKDLEIKEVSGWGDHSVGISEVKEE